MSVVNNPLGAFANCVTSTDDRPDDHVVNQMTGSEATAVWAHNFYEDAVYLALLNRLDSLPHAA